MRDGIWQSGRLRSLTSLALKFGKENHGKESIWCRKVSKSHSSDDLGCRRNAETMSRGYQLAEVSLERSSGLRCNGNKPTWQKIPKSKQRQIRRKSMIRGLCVAEPRIEISVKFLLR